MTGRRVFAASLGCLLSLFAAVGSGNAQTVALTEWILPPARDGLGATRSPLQIDARNGDVYFNDFNGRIGESRLGRMRTTDDTLTEWIVPVTVTNPGDLLIKPGPFGSVFVTDFNILGTGIRTIGRLDPATNTFSKWPLPALVIGPSDVALDPSGNVFFAAATVPSIDAFALSMTIGRLDPSTGTFTFWQVPTALAMPGRDSFFGQVAVDPGGRVFFTVVDFMNNFTSPANNKIGMLDPATGVFEAWAVEIRPCLGLETDRFGNVFFNGHVSGGCGAGVALGGFKAARLDPTTNALTEWTLPADERLTESIAIDAVGAVVIPSARFFPTGGSILRLDPTVSGTNSVPSHATHAAVVPSSSASARDDTTVTPMTTVLTPTTMVTGTAGGPFTTWTLPADSSPRGIAVDKRRTIFYTDQGRGSIGRLYRPPVADAGPDQTTHPGAIAELVGTSSYSPDGDPITFSWTQTVGPSVTLNDATTAKPSFTAPAITARTTLTFTLTVSDGVFSSSDTVDVVVAPFTDFAFEGVRTLSGAGSTGRHPTIAVSGRNVFAVWWTDFTATISFTRSTDTGATFGPVITVSPPPGVCTLTVPCIAAGHVPPVVATSGNRVYVAWQDHYHGLFVRSSEDGGVTFPGAAHVVPLGTGQEGPVQIAVSANFVHLLSSCLSCGPNGMGELYLSTSADFGQTFSTTTLTSRLEAGCCGHIALAQSNLYVVWEETPPSAIAVVTFVGSTNNGATLGTPAALSDPANMSVLPQVAASGNNVYVAWHDQATGEVRFTRSLDAGATFAPAIAVFPAAVGPAAVIPGLASDGMSVYVSRGRAGLGWPHDLEVTASNNAGVSFGPSRSLNNSPLLVGAHYPRTVAEGSSVHVVWGATPPSSFNADVGFAHSTNAGVSFAGAINLSNTPESSELSFGAGNTVVSHVDEIAVSAGTVHVIWSDVASGIGMVKYVRGALVPSPFTVSGPGAASTSVTKDPSGATVISQLDAGGQLLASWTLPPGSTAPSGAATITFSTSGLSSQADVSGLSVPYPPGKTATLLADPATTAVCIDDQPMATFTTSSCTTGPANIPLNLPCDGLDQMVTFSSAPISRTFACSIVPGPGGTSYAVVSGLAFSAVTSVVSPAHAVHRLIDVLNGMHLPGGIAQSLRAKLDAASKAIEAGRLTTAVHQLNAFIREVRAHTGKGISASQAETLIEEAEPIITTLTN